MKRHANAPSPPCPRCLKLAWADQIRKETVMPLPPKGEAPLSREDDKPCCFDCASADGLMALMNAKNEGERRATIVKPLLWKALKRAPTEHDIRGFSFLMARICVGNDRQEQFRLPGAPMGLVRSKMMRPSGPGDLQKHHAWMRKVGLGEGGI